MPQDEKAPRRFSRRVIWLALALVLISDIAMRWRLRECPLERDEGEYAYLGQLILEGTAPYAIAGNHKFPGSYLAYAAIMKLFGETTSGIHTGMLVISLASTLLIFGLGRRLWGNCAGVAASAAWVVLSISAGVFGNAGHLAHFVVLTMLAGALLLWRGTERGNGWNVAASGLFFGISIVFRQTSVVFVLFGLAWLWSTRNKTWRLGAIYLAGSLIPLLAVAIWLWVAGVFYQFWSWTFTQAAAYGSELSLVEGEEQFLRATPLVIGWNVLIWLGAALGMVATFRTKIREGWFVIGLFLSGFIALTPGFYFREHYYLQILPSVALLFGAALAKGWQLSVPWRLMAVSAAVVAALLPTIAERSYFLESSATALARHIYGGNPFPEAVEVARYIEAHSDSKDEIGVLGSEPEIFFYAHRHSATSLIYTYPLMEHQPHAHEMQERMATELERKSPKFIVFVNAPTSWGERADSDMFIFEWASRFLAREYQLDGEADILADGSQFVWGPAATGYHPHSPYTVDVYRRVNN